MSAIRFFMYLLLLSLSWRATAEVEILLEDNFDLGSVKVVPGWGIGSQQGGRVEVLSTDMNLTDTAKVSANSTNIVPSTLAIKATYPKGAGGIYGWASFDVRPFNTNEVYVQFNARMPKAKQGLKFLKIFGDGANTTFGLDYTGIQSGKGSMYQISFGDGSTALNDTQNVINFDGTYPQWIGRSFGKAVVETPEKKNFTAADWGDRWHHFRFKVKFNTVTKKADGTYVEINDGEYYVEIDGKVYVNAKGLFNRHPTNGAISKVALLDWSQNIDQEFEIWYDNVKITTGGFETGNDPTSPQNIKIKSN